MHSLSHALVSSLLSHAHTYTCKHTPRAVLVVHVLGPLGTMRAAAAAQCRLCGAGVVNRVINCRFMGLGPQAL